MGWDVLNVTDMRHMFYNSKFNGDISKWSINKDCRFDYFTHEHTKHDIIRWSLLFSKNIIATNEEIQNISKYESMIKSLNLNSYQAGSFLASNFLAKSTPLIQLDF